MFGEKVIIGDITIGGNREPVDEAALSVKIRDEILKYTKQELYPIAEVTKQVITDNLEEVMNLVSPDRFIAKLEGFFDEEVVKDAQVLKAIKTNVKKFSDTFKTATEEELAKMHGQISQILNSKDKTQEQIMFQLKELFKKERRYISENIVGVEV